MPPRRGDVVLVLLDREIDRTIGRCGDLQPVDGALRHTLGL